MSIAKQARAIGIHAGYRDRHGDWIKTPRRTLEALIEVLSHDGGDDGGDGVMFVRRGEPAEIGREAELITEDGARAIVGGRLPPDVPTGYHELVDLDSGGRRRVIVSPGRCHLPPGLKTWGWAIQLYASRSKKSWGIGDFADLERLGRWSRRLGAGAALVNPFHAVNPGHPQQPSPYFPSSRCWRNPLYLRVEEVPGAAGLAAVGDLAAQGRALNQARLIDRDEVYRLKLRALEEIWRRFEGDPAFDAYARTRGRPLDDFATFMTLWEHHGGPPRGWPSEHRHPRLGGVGRFAREHAGRIAFHRWVQWLLERQLERSGRPLRVIHDLAIGVDPDGADAWVWQDAWATGASVGAPPDQFNSRGQNWHVLGFAPARLRAAAYEPFIHTVRAALRVGGGMRIDHVMGLWRLWFIPPGSDPSSGAYVSFPAAELLDIVALESQRAGAIVIGEDLGTVEPRVREELAARAMLSYRVMWFEGRPPSTYPSRSLATVSNHDLPTVAGLWSGADLRAQQELGLEPDESGTAAIRDRLATWLGATRQTPGAAITRGVYALLSRAPSMIVTATLDDALGVEERPNQPGTTDERPNWSLALPKPLEEIEQDPGAAEIAGLLSAR